MSTQIILQGHALEILKDIPDEFFDTVITSPPYWSLRDYSVEPLIWDGKDGCEHSFNEYNAKLLHENRQGLEGSTIGNNEYRKQLHGFGNAKAGFCSLCGAWRGSLGLEPTFQLYLDHLMQIMGECKRVMKPTGCMFINLGDSYGGSQSGGIEDNKAAKHGTGATSLGNHRPSKDVLPKSLVGIPERFAIRMTDELGMIRRNTIIWYKRSCMPSSAHDRFTVDFEYVYFFTRQGDYWFEQQFEPHLTPIGKPRNRNKESTNQGYPQGDRFSPGERTGYGEQGRNRRCVWDIPAKPFKGAHFAVFPPGLVEPMLKAGCPPDGWVLDPFAGSGTVGMVAKQQDKNVIGIEFNPIYCQMAEERIK